jgi:hypothetical protein
MIATLSSLSNLSLTSGVTWSRVKLLAASSPAGLAGGGSGLPDLLGAGLPLAGAGFAIGTGDFGLAGVWAARTALMASNHATPVSTVE